MGNVAKRVTLQLLMISNTTIVRKFSTLIFIALLISGLFNKSMAQSGGDASFAFLNLPASARIAALGGNSLAINDKDLSLTLNNPSLIASWVHNDISLSFVDYYNSINYGLAQYGRSFEKLGSFVGSVQYINYGTFQGTTAEGLTTNEFSAGDLALNLGWGRSLDSNFSIGANIKFIQSSYGDYNASALAVDVSGSYHLPKNGFTASIMVRNVGIVLNKYYNASDEELPFDVQLGLSKSLAHLPLTFSILFTNLQKWDVTYESPYNIETDPFTGETREVGNMGGFGDKLMRHVVLGAELRPFKAFAVRVGYNYLRRQELKINDNTKTVGFSWGFSLTTYGFSFSYARSAYHLAGSPNFITLSTNLDKVFGRN